MEVMKPCVAPPLHAGIKQLQAGGVSREHRACVAVSELRGAHAELPAKRGCEFTGVGIAYAQRDLGDVETPCKQKEPRLLHPGLAQVSKDRRAEQSSKAGLQPGLVQPGLAGQPGQRRRLLQTRDEAPARALEPLDVVG